MVTIGQAAKEMFTEKEYRIGREKISLTEKSGGQGYYVTIKKRTWFVGVGGRKKAEDCFEEEVKLRRAIEKL